MLEHRIPSPLPETVHESELVHRVDGLEVQGTRQAGLFNALKRSVLSRKRSQERIRHKKELRNDSGNVAGRVAAEKLLERSYTDPTTGLKNRNGLVQDLQRYTEHAKFAPDQSYTIFIIDLDKFKKVNDTGGHDMGDACLLAVADGLRSTAYPGDYLIRLGGDEFAMIATNPEGEELTSQVRTKTIPDRFTENYGDAIMRNPDLTRLYKNEQATFGFSMGSAQWKPGEGQDFFECLKVADDNMYQQKELHHAQMGVQ